MRHNQEAYKGTCKKFHHAGINRPVGKTESLCGHAHCIEEPQHPVEKSHASHVLTGTVKNRNVICRNEEFCKSASEENHHKPYCGTVNASYCSALPQSFFHPVDFSCSVILPCESRNSRGKGIEWTHRKLLQLAARCKCRYINRAQGIVCRLHHHASDCRD